MAKRGRTNLGLATILVALLGATALAACSDDDTNPIGGGGSGSGGKSGAGGGAGKSSGGGAGKGGAGNGGAGAGAVAGEGGDQTQPQGGEGGAIGEAGNGGEGGEGPITPCGPPLIKPTVANTIAVTASAALVAAYAADGVQTYTCTATPGAGGTGGSGGSGGTGGAASGSGGTGGSGGSAAGAGGSGGSTGGTAGSAGGIGGASGHGGSSGSGGSSTTYTWSSSVPTANLYDQSCKLAARHYQGPHWKANDGSTIKGTVVRTTASGTASSIPLVLLSAVVDGGTTGLFTPVTAVQRLDTVGGIAPPSADCTALTAGDSVSVHYKANYYFYSGANSVPPTAP